MKLTIQRQELLTALQRVQGVVEKRNTMPILANILLEAKSEGLDILATDLELAMRGLYKANVEEPGSVTFSARKLFEILKEIREPEVELTVAENSWVTIKAGRSEFRVVGLPSQDYPSLPAVERDGMIPLPSAGLLDLIRRTIFAVGDNDTRYVLNGILVSVISENAKKATLRLVGTDGHRLAMAEEEVNVDQTSLPSTETKVIIPKKAATEIKRLLEEDDNEPMVGFTKNMLIFRKSGLLMTSRVMEGAYPNYQQVIPKESSQKVKVPRAELEGALRRVSLLSRDKSYAIKLSFTQDRIHLSSSNPDLGEANEEISAQHGGDNFEAGFNARYLLDVLSAIDGEFLTMQMETPLSPCLIQEHENPKFKAVVMPVKV